MYFYTKLCKGNGCYKNSNDSTENGVNPKKFQDNPDLAYYSYPIRKNCFIIISSRKKTEKKKTTQRISLLRSYRAGNKIYERSITPFQCDFVRRPPIFGWLQLWTLDDLFVIKEKSLKRYTEELPLVTSTMCTVQKRGGDPIKFLNNRLRPTKWYEVMYYQRSCNNWGNVKRNPTDGQFSMPKTSVEVAALGFWGWPSRDDLEPLQ